ncbi:uncharacterized protein [Drosophila tropicalis]|uniref:uncharacterized protein n=1 Tax=Drosophila tropicalis TaxID=46794 RepID=UPI0035ABB3EA
MNVERQISSSCGVCTCHKKTINGNLVVRQSQSNVRKVETIYRRRLRNDVRPVRSTKYQDSGYSLKRPNIAYSSTRPKCGRRFGGDIRCEEIIAAILFVIMAFMVPLGLYLIRRYNRTFAYGAGGCLSTFVTYDDCQILS